MEPSLFFRPTKKNSGVWILPFRRCTQGGATPAFSMPQMKFSSTGFSSKKSPGREIGEKLEKLISSHDPQNLLTLEAILEVDGLAREKASVV